MQVQYQGSTVSGGVLPDSFVPWAHLFCRPVGFCTCFFDVSRAFYTVLSNVLAIVQSCCIDVFTIYFGQFWQFCFDMLVWAWGSLAFYICVHITQFCVPLYIYLYLCSWFVWAAWGCLMTQCPRELKHAATNFLPQRLNLNSNGRAALPPCLLVLLIEILIFLVFAQMSQQNMLQVQNVRLISCSQYWPSTLCKWNSNFWDKIVHLYLLMFIIFIFLPSKHSDWSPSAKNMSKSVFFYLSCSMLALCPLFYHSVRPLPTPLSLANKLKHMLHVDCFLDAKAIQLFHLISAKSDLKILPIISKAEHNSV